ncbi:undecaprenyl-diphosphate phosphatase [Flexivirga caeni]|uniref:Undecaprenyl-diphosphatase n=1 Tax=Flexivirga caeni TaxID=2294115 RepID=A0A3M9MDV2_9MICO|nr:undecaprenyl-diphosphate phosphatase [Flexivirga caeni]RNI22778.1 undecaprenyl-diphosphate phosphatase [Flexivirga caeni]
MSHLSYLQATVMGALQGVTELFPVSSLGHSLLVPAWIGGSWSALVTQQGAKGATPFLAFIVALHVATALALIAYQWRDWVQVLAGIGDLVKDRRIRTPRARLTALLIVATIPVGIIGLLLDKPLRHLFSHPLTAAIFLTVNGLVLLTVELLTRRARRGAHAAAVEPGEAATDYQNVGFAEATLIGSSQALALLPGISRSGVTISAGLLRGWSHERALHFAFLLATPVILAAGVLKVPELFGPEGKGIGGQVLVGFVVAFVAAYISARWLARFLRTRTLYPFVAYCLVAGVVSIVHFA